MDILQLVDKNTTHMQQLSNDLSGFLGLSDPLASEILPALVSRETRSALIEEERKVGDGEEKKETGRGKAVSL